MKQVIFCTMLAGFGAGTMLADFSYQQTSKVTGGAMAGMMKFAGAFSKAAREPMRSTFLVKGHKMAHILADSAEIIDVDKETITNINFPKKTYSVMTFEQMKQMMQQAFDQASQQQAQKPPPDSNTDVQFKASVKDTGQTKIVSGLTAKEMLITLTMEGTDKQSGQTGALDVSSDLWLAPVAGYEEVRTVERLMAAKLGFVPGQGFGAMMQRPDMQKGLGDLYKEAAKLDGIPVLMVTRMGAPGSAAPGASPAGSGQQTTPAPSTSDAAGTAAASEGQSKMGRLGGLAGGIGGFGGFGHKKKNTDQASNQQPPAASGGGGDAAASAGLLMEITTEASGFSTQDVDGSKFEVPAGFKQVEPQAERRRGR